MWMLGKKVIRIETRGDRTADHYHRGNMCITREAGKAANTAAISLPEGPTAFHSLTASFHSFEPAGMLVMSDCRVCQLRRRDP
jgi:hypothetical protein